MPLHSIYVVCCLSILLLIFTQCTEAEPLPSSESLAGTHSDTTILDYQRADTLLLDSLDLLLKRYKKAEQNDTVNWLFTQKAELCKSKNDLRKWLDTYWDWQRYYWGNPDTALLYLRQWHDNQWREPVRESEWESLLWLYLSEGYQCYNTGSLPGAITAYEQAEHIYSNQQLEHFKRPVNRIYKPLGAYYTMLGDNERARYIYQKALAYVPPPEEDSVGVLAGIYNNIGLAFWNGGDNEYAIVEYQKGLSLSDQGYYLPWYIQEMLRSNLAYSYLELKDTSKAQAYALKALDGMNPIDTDQAFKLRVAEKVANTYLKIAEVLRLTGYPAPIGQLYDKALALNRQAYDTPYHRHFSKIYHSLGRYYLSNDQQEEALLYFDKALQAVIPNFQSDGASSLPRAADFYEENSIFEALEGKADALLIAFEKNNDQSLLRTALRCHELTLAADSRLWNALKNESSKAQLQADRRRRVAKGVAIASRLYKVTDSVAYNRRAYELVSQSKSKLLEDAVQENLAYREIQQQDSIFNRITDKKQLFAAYDKQYQLAPDSTQRAKWLFQKNKVGEELSDLEEVLYRRYPNLKEYKLDVKKEGIPYLTDSMTTIVEYFVGMDSIYAFVLKADAAPDVHLLPTNDRLEVQAKEFVAALKSRKVLENQRPQFLQHSYTLYQWLVSPLGLKPTRELLIIPDGFISYLPFEAMASEATNLPWPEVPFLIKDYEISYTHSYRIYQSLKRNTSEQRAEVLLVSPGFANRENGLPPLYQADQLGEQLSFLAPRVCEGQQANLQTFTRLAPDYGILHLYTHAQGDSTSGIPKIEFIDSALYLPELYALKLNAELVVLGACETGLGRFDQGEGVISLARGFTYAGARNLAASLWKVNEGSTNRIFQSFYQHIADGRTTASALRSAKLDYLKGSQVEAFRKSPYYWAGFVYYGNNTPIPLSEKGPFPWWIVAGIGILILLLIWKLARKP